LDVSKLGIEESVETLSKRTLFEGIMVPRMKEIFELVGKQLDNQGLLELIPAGVVITGGGAETLGITEVAKRVLQLPARIGKPVELQGLVSDIQKPSFATAIGLVHYGRKQGGTVPKRSGFSFSSALQKVNLGKLGESLSRIFKSIMP
jgi:cell division protein FtsA